MPGPCWQNRDGAFWLPEHQKAILDAAGVLTVAEVAVLTGKTAEAVRRYAKRHGIELKAARRKGRKLRPRSTDPRAWPQERVEMLKALWVAGKSRQQIADAMGLTFGQVIGKINRLDLKLSPAEARRRMDDGSRRGGGVTAAKARPKPEKPARQRITSFGPIYFAKPPKVEPPREIANDDRDLIAKFLAQRAVTECPKGYAWGSCSPQYIGKSGRAA